jgi:hypothetical protein
MADDTKDDKANEDEKTTDLEVDEDAKGDGEEDEDEKDSKPDPELQKAIKRRDAAIARARKAEEALAAATKKDGDDKPDPVEVANRRLVNASARTVLASAGVTDKEDQKTILAVLNLSDIDVDDDDGPDEDAIEERISDLRRILGGKAPVEKRTGSRVPKSTSSSDKGGSSNTADADAARYRRFMAGKA